MGVSRGTIRSALSRLQQQGLIWRKQGLGSFISENIVLQNRLDMNTGVTDLIESMGLLPGCNVLEVKMIPADKDMAERLAVPLETPLIYVHRVRTANERPVVASIDIFPMILLQRASRPLDMPGLEKAIDRRKSLYRVFEQDLSIPVDYGIAKLQPVKVNAWLMKEIGLNLPPGSVMLYLEQVDFDRDRQPILLSREYHVADFCEFTVYRHR
jgi:GntR family transcriptional regulator